MPRKPGKTRYKILFSEEYDEYIAAKCDADGKVTMLYEGGELDEAHDAIFKDLGIDVPREAREIGDPGTYKPSKRDFN